MFDTCRALDATFCMPHQCVTDGLIDRMHHKIRDIDTYTKNARKPVMTIKPLAAGRLLPPVGPAFVWNTIRSQDMVTVGTTTPDEAKEVIDLSLDFLSCRLPDNELQATRSKQSLTSPA